MSSLVWVNFIAFLANLLPLLSAEYGCKADLRTDDDSREFILLYHNSLRENIARNVQNYNLGRRKLGPASNMYELEWDCKLDETAQKIADTCDEKAEDTYAQNSVKIKGDTRYNEMSNFMDAMVRFTGDLWLYQGTITNVFNDMNLSKFANMAYSKTTKVGCSYKWCDTDQFFVVCLYNRLGNQLGNVLWEEGTHCLKDEECTTYAGSTCNSQGLCVDAAHADNVYPGEKQEETETTTHPTTETSKPIATNPEGIIGDCPTDNGMTNEIRMRLLEKHNGYRTLVAKGEAENPLGSSSGYAPKAARMRKMVYDCNIELNAMRNAAGCKYGHSSNTDRPGLGENIWAMWGPANYSLLKAAEGATGSWFSELKDPGMPEENVLSDAVLSRPKAIGHYTQIVWQSTYHLGCGLANCPGNMCYAVCQYGPPGNYRNSLVYELGDPCKTDGDCNCTGCTCSQAEALCIMPASRPWTATGGIVAA
ncbi:unnamed protein product [Heligmosomoides polygyrus]|uniref:SCP domain-containing protein n=1 Tax=Heligmosomoides polygyrus TaxID=6339 RepID=A0A183GD96_HELPZ|nr:unnamed protein product [Heligmosomoides polygyrus]